MSSKVGVGLGIPDMGARVASVNFCHEDELVFSQETSIDSRSGDGEDLGEIVKPSLLLKLREKPRLLLVLYCLVGFLSQPVSFYFTLDDS